MWGTHKELASVEAIGIVCTVAPIYLQALYERLLILLHEAIAKQLERNEYHSGEDGEHADPRAWVVAFFADDFTPTFDIVVILLLLVLLRARVQVQLGIIIIVVKRSLHLSRRLGSLQVI